MVKSTMVNESSRIFIGLWPKEKTKKALMPLSRAALQHCGGRALKAEHWHITLAFLGQMPSERLEQLCVQAKQWKIPVSPFLIDQYGAFKHSEIVWAGSTKIDSLKTMKDSYGVLWKKLQPLGFKPENRPFTPHVSLLRQAQDCYLKALPTFKPFYWFSAHCYIVASKPTDGRTFYRPLASIPLVFS